MRSCVFYFPSLFSSTAITPRICIYRLYFFVGCAVVLIGHVILQPKHLYFLLLAPCWPVSGQSAPQLWNSENHLYLEKARETYSLESHSREFFDSSKR